MGKQKLVVIGNGMAGIRCVENILKEDSDAFDITIFGSEPHTSYSRILLSSVLQGETSFEDIVINSYSWYEQNNIELFTGETVVEIDRTQKLLKTDQTRKISYDKLIIATGSSPFILPIEGAGKEGVITFRNIEDCEKMIETSKSHRKAVVIGGGLLGLEAARGLLNLGMEVNVVHISESIMERQLDTEASNLLQEQLEAQGMNFLLEKASVEIFGEKRVEGIRFKDGSKVDTDLVVMAAGVRPNVQLAQSSGIETNRGILVDDVLQTSIPDIYAVGECAEHEGTVYGLVQPLYEQGEILAQHLCSKEPSGYQGSLLSTQLKISGVDVFSVGQITSGPDMKTIHYHNEVEATYKKVIFKGNKAVGAVMFGDTQDGPRMLDAIVKKKVLSDQDKASLLETSDPGDSVVAFYPMNEQICTCNSVNKGTIIQAVQEENLSTVEEVKQCTKASSSCGGCKPVVSNLLAYIHSDQFSEGGVGETSLCSCTRLTEDELVEQIQLQNLTNVQEIMIKLEWKTENGCPTCRLALDYYLGMINPGHEEKADHLFVNERKNAAVQGDGRYAVVPQLYGGAIDVEQLRNIMNVADKYPLERIAIASDQRIHLLGVSKEDLTNVWNELNMPLRSPDGNRIETIKTNIGGHICRCEKQSSLELAQDIERKTELLRTPYRIKIGISSCLHNGAGSTSKDVGALKVDGRWEIYIGGSSGRNVREGQLLCVVDNDKQAERMMLGCIQYYRKSARYLERTWQWVERLGLVHIREALFDQELCDHLLETLEEDVVQKRTQLVNI
ncbi:nitrite reductase large subunit NirB [Halobacillus seohaensis]|uniref:Nitrite reductase large subunit NirB n=1 Tax=Halobacillus seohaensis TaxID=447421 RepID=A0ABW2ENP8_9BACI